MALMVKVYNSREDKSIELVGQSNIDANDASFYCWNLCKTLHCIHRNPLNFAEKRNPLEVSFVTSTSNIDIVTIVTTL